MAWWVGGVVVWASDSQSRVRWFDSWPFRCTSCSHPCASVTKQKQYNLVPAKDSAAGEVTAGLAASNGSLPQGL